MPVELPSAEQAGVPGYRVGPPLPGRVSEGTVYAAETEDGRQVELWLAPASDRRFAARFLDGAEALAALDHGHIPRILDSGESEESVYAASEPNDGTTLQELVEMNEGIAPMRAIRLLGDVADALDAAHEAGVSHGRLSPSSVVVQGRTVERALLRDFALGREGRPEEDLRDFAAVMFECLTGSPAAGVPASEVRPQLPQDLDGVLARGLSDDPRERPPGAARLVADAAKAVMAARPAPAAAAAADTELVPAPAAQSAPAKADRVPLRRRLGAATVPLALAVVVVIVAAVGGWFVGKPEPAAKAPKKASSGTVEVSPPAGWVQARPARRLGGLALHDAVAARGPAAGRVDAGLVSGTLPSRVAARVARNPGRAEAVRLGDLQAYRWRGIDERGGGGRRVTLFAAGTDAGIVALTCQGGAAAIARCETAAGSLSVPASLPAELSELAGWSTRLDRTMARLDRGRRRDRSALRTASTPGGLSRIARRLASDYSAARRSVAAGRAPAGAAGAQREIERTLRAIASSYRRLGSAARRQRRGAYRDAGRSVARGERSLQRTLRSL